MYRRINRVGWSHASSWGLLGVVTALWLTGCMMYLLPADELADMSAAQEWMRRVSFVAHGVLSWLFCLICGRGLWPHVQMMWCRNSDRCQWMSGLVNLGWFVFLAAGGLLMLYGSAWVHEMISPWHFWLGLLGPMIFFQHTWSWFRHRPPAR